MRPEDRAAAFLWNAVTFARNVGVAVGPTSLEAYLEGGPVAWATERQVELVGEAPNNLRKAAPELAERIPDVHKPAMVGNRLADVSAVISAAGPRGGGVVGGVVERLVSVPSNNTVG